MITFVTRYIYLRSQSMMPDIVAHTNFHDIFLFVTNLHILAVASHEQSRGKLRIAHPKCDLSEREISGINK